MITSLVVAAAQNDVIGREQSLPWYLPEDLKYFRRLTLGHAVVMGRATHESILARLGHPLTGRTSIVVSSRAPEHPDAEVIWVASVEAAIAAARELASGTAAGEFFVIGGASVYQQALPHVDKIYLTRIHHQVSGDSRLPAGWLDGFRLASQDDRPRTDTGLSYSFQVHVRELP